MRYHVLLAGLMASLAVYFPQLSVLSSALRRTLPPPSVSPSPIPLVPSAPQSVSPLPYRQPNTDIPCDILPNIAHTFYSISTNENRGPNIAYDCGNRARVPGGLGTYDNPLTFASAPAAFQRCELIYDPYLRKYLRNEDYCAGCEDDWNSSGLARIEVWIGNGLLRGSVDEEVECQRGLMTPGRLEAVIRAPRRNLDVDATPLYVPSFNTSSTCNADHIYPFSTPEDSC